MRLTRASVCTHPRTTRIPRHLTQGTWALVKLRCPCPMEQGWTGRACLQGPWRSLCGVVTGGGDGPARRHRAPRPHPSRRLARKADSREACSGQVTQPASSPAKCVSETYPSQQTLSLKTTARLNRLCAFFCLNSVRGTGLNRVGDRTKPCAPRWQPAPRSPCPLHSSSHPCDTEWPPQGPPGTHRTGRVGPAHTLSALRPAEETLGRTATVS